MFDEIIIVEDKEIFVEGEGVLFLNLEDDEVRSDLIVRSIVRFILER